jgi:hypothetical protein
MPRNREPEYRRRIREETENKKRQTDQAEQGKRIDRLVTAISALEQQQERHRQEDNSQHRRDRLWQRAEVIALAAAAVVGVVAIVVGNADSRHQQKLMRGQLNAMQNAERPAIWISDQTGAPKFGWQNQVVWQYSFKNYGQTTAQNVTFADFIKVGDKYVGQPLPKFGGQMPAGKSMDAEVVSPPDITTPDKPAQLLEEDRAIGVLVEFDYSDAVGKRYHDAICMERLATGAINFPDPAKCEAEK